MDAFSEASVWPPLPPPPAKVPDMNPAHAIAPKIATTIASAIYAVNGNVGGISWQLSEDTNVVYTTVYAGPDTNTPALMFRIPATGTNTSFYWPAPGTFQVWATYTDIAGTESDASPPLTFTSPPGATNIVLSWTPARSNVSIQSSLDLKRWQLEISVNGTDAVLSITNSPYRFYRAMTTDGGPPVNLNQSLQ